MNRHETLIDGREVPGDSPEWQAEVKQRAAHVASLRSLDAHGRQAYLADLERAEGTEARIRVALACIEEDRRRDEAARAALARWQATHSLCEQYETRHIH